MAHFPDIKELQAYKVIFFDLDNTLYPYKPAHEAALSASLARFAHDHGLDSDSAKALYKQSRDIIHHRLHGQGASHSRLLYFKEMLQAAGKHQAMDMALDYDRLYWNTFLAAMQPDNEAFALIEALHAAGHKLGIITDLTTAIQLEKFKLLQLGQWFSHMITSEEAGVEKPQADIFNMALKAFNVQPNDCAMIGDNIKTDGGAEALGIKTFIIQLPGL